MEKMYCVIKISSPFQCERETRSGSFEGRGNNNSHKQNLGTRKKTISDCKKKNEEKNVSVKADTEWLQRVTVYS